MNVAAFCILSMTAWGASPSGYVLEFSGKTCPPCQQMAPIVSKLEREGLPIRSVDVEEDRGLAEQYQVTSIPTFILIVDGREVERTSGSQPEGRIRQLLAKVPGQGRERGTGNDKLAVDLGESAPLPRPEITDQSEPRPSKKSFALGMNDPGAEPRRMWPFPKKSKGSVPAEVRGNNADLPSAAESAISSMTTPMDSSVRVRVMSGNSLIKGSGTIIESRAGRTIILTCSHICRGATDETKVEIDLFRNRKPMTFVGTIIGTDPEADVGLLTIPTDEVFPFSPIAALSQSPAVGARVASIGCSEGADPSREQMRVTVVNKFKGPDTLACSEIPVQGRSGGGLFDETGHLVGVCFAADADDRKVRIGGVYCGLRPIYELLTKHEISHLIPPDIDVNQLAEADSSPPKWSQESDLSEAASMPSHRTEEPTRPAVVLEDAGPAAEEFEANDAEVVVIIRGSAGDKVIMLHKPSRKFLQFVAGEVSLEASEATPVTQKSRVVPTEAPTVRLVQGKPTTQLLLPTGLETQRVPRPYVRAVR